MLHSFTRALVASPPALDEAPRSRMSWTRHRSAAGPASSTITACWPFMRLPVALVSPCSSTTSPAAKPCLMVCSSAGLPAAGRPPPSPPRSPRRPRHACTRGCTRPQARTCPHAHVCARALNFAQASSFAQLRSPSEESIFVAVCGFCLPAAVRTGRRTSFVTT